MRAARVAGVLCLALGVGLGIPVSVAGGTKNQCTCYVGDRGNKEHGGEVTNASECVLTADRDRKWCTFEVQALKGSKQHRSSTSQANNSAQSGNKKSAAKFLLSRLRAWDQMRQELPRPEGVRQLPSDTLEQLSRRLDDTKNVSRLFACVTAFASGDESSLEISGDEAFRCGVPPSGWLTVGFDFDGLEGFYLLGPWTSRER